jgi:pimeloyl-ACP methyl ester carboxylesterase
MGRWLWVAWWVLAGCSETRSPDADAAIADAGTTELPDAGGSRDAGRAPDASALDAGAVSDGTPETVGPYAVTTSSDTIEGATVPAFIPTLAGGQRAPLVVMKHGFQLATADYAELCRHIASHGFVVIGVDTGGSLFGGGGPTNVQERDATIRAIDLALSTASYTSMVDAERIAVLGHSRGGKVAIMVAAADPRVDAALLLDPVNGCGPGASYSESCPDVTTGAFAGALTIPVGVMGETHNATGGFMPCAPTDQNYQTIYAALTRTSWVVEWTFTGADHMDFTDTGGGFVGSLCPDGPGDDAQIRRAVRALSTAFVRHHLRAEAAMTEWLIGAAQPPDIEHRGP